MAKSNDVYLNSSQEQLFKDVITSIKKSKDSIKKSKDTTELITKMKNRSKHGVTKFEDIKVGSEISYGRFGYKHHAVVVEINEYTQSYRIIHLSGSKLDSFMASTDGNGKAKPTLETMPIQDIKKQKTLQYTYDIELFNSTFIKTRADALIDLYCTIEELDYDLRKFNCQHFASYCVTGIPFCKPLDKTLCCGKRGLEFNFEAKKVLDDKLMAFFSEKLPLQQPYFPSVKPSSIKEENDSIKEEKDSIKEEKDSIKEEKDSIKEEKDSPVVEASSPLPNIPD